LGTCGHEQLGLGAVAALERRPVPRLLQRGDLAELERAQDDVGRMQPAEARGDALVEEAVVLDRRGPGGPADQTDAAHQSSRSHVGEMPRAYWISSLLTPAATMGHTIASRETVKSTTTGWSSISRAFLIVSSTSAGLSQRSPTQ